VASAHHPDPLPRHAQASPEASNSGARAASEKSFQLLAISSQTSAFGFQ